jgi:hypothetical protein
MKHPFKTLLPVLLVTLALSAPRLHAAVTLFTFSNGFNGANERPAPVVSGGSAVINTLQFDSSIGAFGRFDVNLSFSGLTSAANNSHIHGYTNVNFAAGVIQPLTFTAATSGTISGTWSPASAAQVDALFNGLTYVNLHSANFPGGELRGQLAPVPEPSTYAMGGLGVILLALLRWRRTRAAAGQS